MKETTPNILIIGGGAAGLAAARGLADQDMFIHLVEKQGALGGHAAMWACMATDTCENCGACLSIEMADQVRGRPNCSLHLNTTVTGIEKQASGYRAILDDGSSIPNVRKIIMATGFEPFDPSRSPSLHYGDCPNVITTARLNTLLKQNRLSEVLNGRPDPKIAFIQCVGSRNRQQGRDYCSQVCCAVSMRHANKLLHLFPEAGITLFYMDLQIIGKETRAFYDRLSRNVTLVQGVPAEILEHPETGGPCIVTEDPATASRVRRTFDLVVLSVGMRPQNDIRPFADMLGITPNAWGFFNTNAAILSPDVFPAGCASGPKNILSAIQEGRSAALRVLEDLDRVPARKMPLAVLGDGAEADDTARFMAAAGYPVQVFGSGRTLTEDGTLTVFRDSRLTALRGTFGHFTIDFESGGQNRHCECGAVIAVPDPVKTQIRPEGTTNPILDLDTLARLLRTTPEDCPATGVILLDQAGPEHKSAVKQALNVSLLAKSYEKNLTVILNRMLVHGPLGQKLYDAARKRQIEFLRYNTLDDLTIEDAGGGYKITLREATLPSTPLTLTCDALILPLTLSPSPGFADLAALLKQPLDREGFLQSANTRHRPTRSYRKGVFFAGSGHDEIDADDLHHELREISAALAAECPGEDSGGSGMDPIVAIHQQKCAQCLTCLRICPHNAIILNDKNRPQIVPEACFSCHLCVASCPAQAIDSKITTNDQVAGRVKPNAVTILACERSAALAADSLSLPDTATLIPVACACRVSTELILKALINGASKVFVCGCHEDNCRSRQGGRTASESVRKVLSIPGMNPDRVRWEPVAANEPARFERMIAQATE